MGYFILSESLTGFAEILDRRFRNDLPVKAVGYLDNIVKAGKQMGDLIDDLLAYSRLGKGSQSSDSVDLNELFDTVSSSISSRVKDLKAQVTIQQDMPIIQTNASP